MLSEWQRLGSEWDAELLVISSGSKLFAYGTLVVTSKQMVNNRRIYIYMLSALLQCNLIDSIILKHHVIMWYSVKFQNTGICTRTKSMKAVTFLLLLISNWTFHDVCQRFLYNQEQNFSLIRQKTQIFPIDPHYKNRPLL